MGKPTTRDRGEMALWFAVGAILGLLAGEALAAPPMGGDRHRTLRRYCVVECADVTAAMLGGPVRQTAQSLLRSLDGTQCVLEDETTDQQPRPPGAICLVGPRAWKAWRSVPPRRGDWP